MNRQLQSFYILPAKEENNNLYNHLVRAAKHKRHLLLLVMAGMLLLVFCGSAVAQKKPQVVRLANIVIDSAQLESYKAALTEGIETAVRVEPGVLSLSAVYDKNNPTHVTVLELYADKNAYEAHLRTPHFKKYKTTTKDMVKSLELIDVVPIAMATKSR